MLIFRFNVVNKKEFNRNPNCKNVIIEIPKKRELLKKDFEYLGLDYKNLSIQDTQILTCEIIETNDLKFSKNLSNKIEQIIKKANEMGKATTYQDIKNMYFVIKTLESEYERKTLLAVLELKKNEICNINDVVRFCNNLDWFVLGENIKNLDDYGEYLLDELSISEIIEYIDLKRLGKAYLDKDRETFTEYGMISESYCYGYGERKIIECDEEIEY